MHRLGHFVKEKLKGVGITNQPIELLHNSNVLDDQTTLQDISKSYCCSLKEIIILNYRKRREVMLSYNLPSKPNPLRNKNNFTSCANPNCRQEFGITKAKLNCYCCGEVFCEDCTPHKAKLHELGYKDPVTVCIHC